MILFYARKGFIKTISNDLYKIMEPTDKEKSEYKRHQQFTPYIIYRFNSFIYIEDIYLYTSSTSNPNEIIRLRMIKQTENIKKYCNPIIKKEYDKLLITHFYKDINNIITDYLL